MLPLPSDPPEAVEGTTTPVPPPTSDAQPPPDAQPTSTTDGSNPTVPALQTAALPLLPASPKSPKSPTNVTDYSDYARGLLPLYPGLPRLDVVLRDVSYIVPVVADKSRRYNTPGLVSALLGQLTCASCRERKVGKCILRHVSLHLKPGKSTLILGPPSCGTSSLLKAIGGLLKGQESLGGEVLCNDKPITSVNWKKLVSFCGQYDIQFAEMTVRNTFKFTSMCLNGDGVLRRLGYPELDTDARDKPNQLLSMLGLKNCADTIVGDDVHRGCSGGEKKRVSIGESLCGPSRILLLDKFSTGLDSAMTYDINRFLKQWVTIFEGILVCHLLQPDPQVIALFDDLIVLEHGSIIYYGPPSEGIPYFESLGLYCPPEKDIGSFLSDVAVRDNRPMYSRDGCNYSTDEMAQFYYASSQFARLRDEIGVSLPASFDPAVVPSKTVASTSAIIAGDDSKPEAPATAAAAAAAVVPESPSLAPSSVAPAPSDPPEMPTPPVVPNNPYNQAMFNSNTSMGFWKTYAYLFRFQMKAIFSDMGTLLPNVGQLVVMGLLIGWLFFQGDRTDYIKKYGVFVMVFVAANQSSMPVVMKIPDQRPVVYKQIRQGCYPPATYILSMVTSQYFIQLIQTIIFGSIVYYMHGLTNAGIHHFFIFLLIIFLMFLNFSSLFSIFLYLMDSLGSAMALISLLFLFLNYFNGFSLTLNNIPVWLVEFYYINPVAYCLKALAVNEFTSSDYSAPPDPNSLTGVDYLKAFDMPTTNKDLWFYLLLMFVLHVVFVILQIIILTFKTFDPHPYSSSVDEAADLKPMNENEMSESISRLSSSKVGLREINFSFRDISYSVKVKDPVTKKTVDKVLLDHVSGYVLPNSMTALMGASGAGKTTLLDVLADRKTAGKISGKRLINGAEFGKKELCIASGYVEQNDTLPTTETVREAFLFTARLRYPGHPTDQTLEKYVDEVIETLGLQSYTNSMIGALGAGLPMGIRKLVMLGIEMSANPSLIFLDEPTTGLDSSAALAVVQTLQKIAATGRSIICTIHQPSLEIFSLFSDVLLLERGGRVVYFGKTGKAGSEVVSYMQSIPGVPEKGPDENPASYMLDVTGAGVGGSGEVHFGELYSKSDLYNSCQARIDELESRPEPVVSTSAYSSSFCRQLSELTKRYFRTAYRRMDFNVPRIRIIAIFSIFSGLIYLQLKPTTHSAVQSIWGSVNSLVMTLGMNNMMSIIPIFLSIRLVFYREDSMRCYNPIAHWMSQMIVEAIYVLGLTLGFSAIFYPMIGFDNSILRWLSFVLSLFIWLYNAVFIAIMFSYLLPVAELAQMCTGVTVTILSSCSGFSMPYSTMKAPWKWVYWANPMTMVMQSMAIDQFKCRQDPCPTFMIGSTSTRIQDYFESMYSIRFDDKWLFVGLQAALLVVSWLISLLALSKVRYITR